MDGKKLIFFYLTFIFTPNICKDKSFKKPKRHKVLKTHTTQDKSYLYDQARRSQVYVKKN